MWWLRFTNYLKLHLLRCTYYLMQHRWQALGVTFAVTFIPLIGALGILYATFVTLAKSAKEGAVLVLAATVPYLISYYLRSQHDPSDLFYLLLIVIGFAILNNIFTWIFALMLRRQATWSTVLQVGALVGVLFISVLHLVYPNVAQWWGAQLQISYQQAATLAGLAKSTSLNTSQLEFINVTKYYVTGILVTGVLLISWLRLALARWWQAIVYRPGMLQRELHHIRLSRLAGLLFIVSCVLWYMGNEVVLDMMPVMFVLFSLAGLSVVHFIFGFMRTNINSKITWFWLAVFYMVLFLSGTLGWLLLTSIALFDIAFDVRKRFKKI